MVNARGGLLTLAAVWWLPTASCESGDVSDLTTVTATASSYDDRPLLEGGCYSDGCEPELTIDGLSTDVDQSRWSCEATETEPCYITYTLGETRMVETLFLYFTNVTEDMPVIISTAESTDDEYVAQIISDVSWSYSDVVTVEIDLIPVPSAAAVRVEADLPAGGWVSLLETYIYVTLDDDEAEEAEAAASSSSSGLGGLIGILIFAGIFCCCGCYLYHKCCADWGASASASAAASSSASASASSGANATTQIHNNIQMPAYPPQQQTHYPQVPMNGYPQGSMHGQYPPQPPAYGTGEKTVHATPVSMQ